VTQLKITPIAEQERALDALKQEIIDELAAARQAGVSLLEHWRNAGASLTRAKQQIAHGRWLPWLHDNFRLNERTAARYMRIDREWPKVSQISHSVANQITLRQLDKLLADPTRRRTAPHVAEDQPPLTGAHRHAFVAAGLKTMAEELRRLSDDEAAACVDALDALGQVVAEVKARAVGQTRTQAA
jgi:hypothetical protein